MTEKCRFYWDLIMNLDSKYTIMKNNAGKRFERAVNEKYMLVKSINKSDRTTRFPKVSGRLSLRTAPPGGKSQKCCYPTELENQVYLCKRRSAKSS